MVDERPGRTGWYPEPAWNLMAGSFDYNPAGLLFLVTDPTGGIANELARQGQRVVVASEQFVGRDVPGFFGRQWRNPPPGPPLRRTGDLQASIRATAPRVVDGVLQVQVLADATHGGYVYPQVLQERGYLFVDLNSLGGV